MELYIQLINGFLHGDRLEVFRRNVTVWPASECRMTCRRKSEQNDTLFHPNPSEQRGSTLGTIAARLVALFGD